MDWPVEQQKACNREIATHALRGSYWVQVLPTRKGAVKSSGQDVGVSASLSVTKRGPSGMNAPRSAKDVERLVQVSSENADATDDDRLQTVDWTTRSPSLSAGTRAGTDTRVRGMQIGRWLRHYLFTTVPTQAC